MLIHTKLETNRGSGLQGKPIARLKGIAEEKTTVQEKAMVEIRLERCYVALGDRAWESGRGRSRGMGKVR